MTNFTKDTPATFFNETSHENEWGEGKQVNLCYRSVHLIMNFYRGGDRKHNTDEASIRVVEACENSCKKSFHKQSSLRKIWKDCIFRDDDLGQFEEDIPILIKQFIETGIIGESSREEEDSYSQQYKKLLRP